MRYGLVAFLACLAAGDFALAAGVELRDSEALFALTDRSDRLARLTEILAGADRETCAAWAGLVDRQPPCGAREEDRQRILEYWAAADPQAALAHVESLAIGLRFKAAAYESVARGWTWHSPDEAWRWSRAAVSLEQSDLPKAVLEAVAEKSPSTGLRWLNEGIEAAAKTSRARETSAAAEHAFAFFYRLVDLENATAYREMIENYPEGAVREHLLFAVTERYAADEPEAAAAWALGRRDKPDAFYALAGVASQKSQRDPYAALDWVLAMKPDDVRRKLVNLVAAETVQKDPSLACIDRLLAKVSRPEDREAAYTAFAQTEELIKVAPDRLLMWAWEISDREWRRVSLVRGYAHWTAFDPAAAARHLAENGEKSPEDRRAVQNYLKGAE